MAKVEQFPDQAGANTTTEDLKEQKTQVFPKEIKEQAGKAMPDDSLLMGSSTGRQGGTEKAADPDGKRGRRPEPEADEDGKGKFRLPSNPFRRKDPDDLSSDGLSYQERIRQHRGRIRSYRFFAVVLVIMAILLTTLYVTNRHYNRAEISTIRDFVSEEGAVCANFDGYVLQYGPNGATCADTNGHVKWSITFEMDQPIISISGKVAAIADYGGRTIYVMDKKKQLYTVSTSLPIHKVAASECGEVAAVLDDKSTSWIRLYSSEGKEIAYFVRSMQENGYPMDVAVSPNGSMICISSLLMKDTTVISNLSFYDFGKAGKDYEQHMVGNFEYENEVFPYVRFMSNNTCTAASDARFVIIDTSGTEPKNSMTNLYTENLQGVFEDGNDIGLLFTDLTRENLYRLDLYGRDGKKEGSVGFTMVYDDLQIKGGRIYINNEQSMQIYTTDGKEIFNGGFDRAIKLLIPSRFLGGLTAVSENEIDAIKLR